MAKTTKVTKTNNKSSAKATKTSNKSGKLSFLTNKINFRSRKIQFLLTILVFALVGGAWFTYKSFAAVGTNLATFSVSKNNLVGSRQNDGSSWRNINDAIPVLEVNGPAFATSVHKGELESIFRDGKVYITCAKVKKVSGDPYIIVSGPGINGAEAQRQRVTSTDYSEYCTTQGEGNGILPSVLNNSGTGNVIRVESIYVNTVTTQPTNNGKAPAPTPNPAPTPTK